MFTCALLCAASALACVRKGSQREITSGSQEWVRERSRAVAAKQLHLLLCERKRQGT